MEDMVNVHHLLRLIDGIEDPPFADRVLAQVGQIRADRLMPQIIDVGGDPLGLVEKTLSHRCVDGL